MKDLAGSVYKWHLWAVQSSARTEGWSSGGERVLVNHQPAVQVKRYHALGQWECGDTDKKTMQSTDTRGRGHFRGFWKIYVKDFWFWATSLLAKMGKMDILFKEAISQSLDFVSGWIDFLDWMLKKHFSHILHYCSISFPSLVSNALFSPSLYAYVSHCHTVSPNPIVCVSDWKRLSVHTVYRNCSDPISVSCGALSFHWTSGFYSNDVALLCMPACQKQQQQSLQYNYCLTT